MVLILNHQFCCQNKLKVAHASANMSTDINITLKTSDDMLANQRGALKPRNNREDKKSRKITCNSFM